MAALAFEHSQDAARALEKLQKVIFHACCHGSTRRKSTAWLSTPGLFEALNATCQNDRPYERWGVKWQSDAWVLKRQLKLSIHICWLNVSCLSWLLKV